MSKTLDQLPVGTTPNATDLFLTQQGGLDRQTTYSVIANAILSNLPTLVPPIKVTNAHLADLASSVAWANVTNTPTTWPWSMLVGTPTTLTGYGITDAVRNNASGSLNGSLSITGDLTVTGNVTITGTTTQVNTTQVNISDNVININSNLTGAPPSNLQGGINVNRGTSAAYQFLWDEGTQAFRIGQVGGLQAVATRSDSASMTDKGIAWWNASGNMLKTSTGLTYDNATSTLAASTITSTVGNITSAQAVVADGAAGFCCAAYVANGRSPIYYLGNAAAYGISYFQGSAGIGGDTIGIHFNATTAAGSQFQFKANGDLNAVGTITGAKVSNAVWNDIADFIEVEDDFDVMYGRAYSRLPDGRMTLAQGYMQKGVLGIASDTYGIGVGTKEGKKTIPLAIGGFVLAHIDKEYEPGTPLTCTEGGVLTEFDMENKMRYPERMLAIFDKVERQTSWNGVAVNGRHWVKVL